MRLFIHSLIQIILKDSSHNIKFQISTLHCADGDSNVSTVTSSLACFAFLRLLLNIQRDDGCVPDWHRHYLTFPVVLYNWHSFKQKPLKITPCEHTWVHGNLLLAQDAVSHRGWSHRTWEGTVSMGGKSLARKLLTDCLLCFLEKEQTNFMDMM